MKHAKDIVEPIFSAHCQAAIVLKPSQQAVGSPRLCLEADFRQRYNQTVPADRESADVPLGGEVTRQKALLNELFARVSEAIVLLDTDDRILRVNPEFTRIFGYAEEEALGRPVTEVLRLIDSVSGAVLPNAVTIVTQGDRSALATTKCTNCTLVRRDGLEFGIENRVAIIHDRDGDAIGAVISLRDVSTARAASLEMSRVAQHDVLTQLPNRALFDG